MCDLDSFFSRVDRVLRRSLGVSETAPTDETVRPAPPVDPKLPSEESEEEEDDGKARVIVPDHLKDDVSLNYLATRKIADLEYRYRLIWRKLMTTVIPYMTSYKDYLQTTYFIK